MSGDQVITESDLIFVELSEQGAFESFTSFDNLIGKKVTSNLARGTVLKLDMSSLL